jgi:hypothetical protein
MLEISGEIAPAINLATKSVKQDRLSLVLRNRESRSRFICA